LTTKKEEIDYKKLKDSLKNEKVDEKDTNAVVHHMFANRTKYSNYISYREIFVEMIKVMSGPLMPFLKFTCKCRKLKKGTAEYKKEKRFINGSHRFADEIDLIKIIKQIRISKMLFKTKLTPEERLLL
jgi:hypothetical protein